MLTQKTKGFTLVELSIVLVIISLIVGGVIGVIGGKSLIHSARIGQQVAQLHEFRVAYNNFQLQYDAMPGDFREATSFWPSGGTANGDGNNLLEGYNGRLSVGEATFTNEFPLFFEHLSLAVLLADHYDGSSDFGVGFPRLIYDDGAGMIAGMSGPYEAGSCAALVVKLYLQIGSPENMPALNNADNGSIFTSRDAKLIDKKLDDGIALTGHYCSWNGFGAATGSCHNNGAYNVASQAVACRSSFRL